MDLQSPLLDGGSESSPSNRRIVFVERGEGPQRGNEVLALSLDLEDLSGAGVA